MKKLLLLVSLISATAYAQTTIADFQGSTTMPSNIVVIRNHNQVPAANVSWANQAWVVRTNVLGETGNNAAASTSWFAPAGVADEWMIIQNIPVPSNGFLTWRAVAPDVTYQDGYEVYVSTNSQASTVADFSQIPAALTVAAEQSTWKQRSLNLSALANQTVSIAIRNNSNDKFLLYVDDFKMYQVNSINAAMMSNEIPEYAAVNAPMTIKAVLKNDGLNITSMTINYRVDGGATVSQNLTGLNIGFLEEYTMTFSQAYTPASAGTKAVEIWASNINGGSAQTAIMNASFFAGANLPQRKVLVESFTSSTCAPCAAANPAFNTFLTNNGANTAAGKIAAVKYQQNYPSPGTDPGYTQESGDRHDFYGVGGIPNVNIGNAYDGHPNSLNQGIVDAEYAKPGAFTIDVTANVTSAKVVSASAVVTSKIATSSTALKFYMALVDDEYVRAQMPVQPTTSEQSFKYVFRKFLPDGNGTAMPAQTVDLANTITQNYTFGTSPALFSDDPAKVSIVAWVQNPTTKVVYQAAWIKPSLGGVSVSEKNSSGKILLFPNPAQTHVNIRAELDNAANAEVSVINAIGQVVYTKTAQVGAGEQLINVPLNGLAKGVYFVNVVANGKRFTEKLTVVQ